MKIIKFKYYNEETLVENLRKMHLKGLPDRMIYKNAKIYIKRNVIPENIIITQYYVLEKDLREISELREALLEYGVDIFHLIGFVRIFYYNDSSGTIHVFDVLPPVVEISKADGGIPLLNDGMHRLYLARELNSTMNVVMVENFDERFPYYAFPNEGGWTNIIRCVEPPEIKKNYRIKDYKTLFRDFNTCFLNVTQVRTDKIPKILKVQGEKVVANE